MRQERRKLSSGNPLAKAMNSLGQPHCRAAALELGGCEAASDGSLIARDNPCGAHRTLPPPRLHQAAMIQLMLRRLARL